MRVRHHRAIVSLGRKDHGFGLIDRLLHGPFDCSEEIRAPVELCRMRHRANLDAAPLQNTQNHAVASQPRGQFRGERGGSFAGRVFWGLGLGGAYTFFMNTFQAWTGQPESRPSWYPGASFRAAITSEYLGVGYIIGPKVSGILFAGGIISWLVMMPAIRFYGQLAGNVPIYPSTVPIPLMSPDDIWRSYIRPMGAGAVAAAGLITLLRTLPTIISALRAGLKDVRAEGALARRLQLRGKP